LAEAENQTTITKSNRVKLVQICVDFINQMFSMFISKGKKNIFCKLFEEELMVDGTHKIEQSISGHSVVVN
jgi:hypothetical protein